ncbi:hypothetical protein BH10BAC2_BH10BAC2_07210 [soil metagenome]
MSRREDKAIIALELMQALCGANYFYRRYGALINFFYTIHFFNVILTLKLFMNPAVEQNSIACCVAHLHG